jgi:hypothetical protein
MTMTITTLIEMPATETIGYFQFDLYRNDKKVGFSCHTIAPFWQAKSDAIKNCKDGTWAILTHATVTDTSVFGTDLFTYNPKAKMFTANRKSLNVKHCPKNFLMKSTRTGRTVLFELVEHDECVAVYYEVAGDTSELVAKIYFPEEEGF